MTPIMPPQAQWNPPGAGEVSRLMQMNATSPVYQPTWGYVDSLGHYLGTNPELPEGYTRKQYNEERAMAAQEMSLSPGSGLLELVAGTAATHLAFTVFPSLPGVETVNSIVSRAAAFAGDPLGRLAGGLFGGMGNVAFRHTGYVTDLISQNLFGRTTGIQWGKIANAGTGLMIKGGGFLGSMGLGLLSSFFSPSAIVGMEAMGEVMNYSKSFWDIYKTENDIRRDMIAKSDRILRFGAANSSMGIQGGMTESQRDRIVGTIETMAQEFASKKDYMGAGKWGLLGGRDAYSERIKELKAILNVGTDMGMFDMSRSMDDFEKKFKETVKVVERMSRMIQRSKGEIMSLIGSVQQNEGIFNYGQIVENINRKNLTAAATGVDLSTVMMEAQAGVQLGRQYGYSSAFSARVMGDSRLMMSRAIRAGDLSREEMHRLGGEQHIITSLADANFKLMQDQSVMAELAMAIRYDADGNKTFDNSRIRAAASGNWDVLASQAVSRSYFVNGLSRNWRQNNRLMKGGEFQAALPDVQEMIANGEISQSDLYSLLISQVQNRHRLRNPGASRLGKEAALREAMAMYGIDPRLRTVLSKGISGEYDDMAFDESQAATRAIHRKMLDQRVTVMDDFYATILTPVSWAINGVSAAFGWEGGGIWTKEDYLRRRAGKSVHAIDQYYKGYSDLSLDEARFSYTAEDLKYRMRREDKALNLTKGDDISNATYYITKGSMDAATRTGSLQQMMDRAQALNYTKEEGSAVALLNSKYMRGFEDSEDYKKYQLAIKQMYEAASNNSKIELSNEEQLQNYSYVLGHVLSRTDGTRDSQEFVRRVSTNVTYHGNTIKSLQSGNINEFREDRDHALSLVNKGTGWGNLGRGLLGTAATALGFGTAGAVGGGAVGFTAGSIFETASILAGNTLSSTPLNRVFTFYGEEGIKAAFFSNGWRGFKDSIGLVKGAGLKAAGVTAKAAGLVVGLASLGYGVYQNREQLGRGLGIESALDTEGNAIDRFKYEARHSAESGDYGYFSYNYGKNLDLFRESSANDYDVNEIDDLANFMSDTNNGLAERDRDRLVEVFEHISHFGNKNIDPEKLAEAVKIASGIGQGTDSVNTRKMLTELIRRDDITASGKNLARAIAKLLRSGAKGTGKLRLNAQNALNNAIKAIAEKSNRTKDDDAFLSFYNKSKDDLSKYYYASASGAFDIFNRISGNIQGPLEEKKAIYRRLGFKNERAIDLFLDDSRVTADDIINNASDYGLDRSMISGMTMQQIKQELHLQAWVNKMQDSNKTDGGSDIATTKTSKDGKGQEITSEAMEKFYQGCLLLNNITTKLMGLY